MSAPSSPISDEDSQTAPASPSHKESTTSAEVTSKPSIEDARAALVDARAVLDAPERDARDALGSMIHWVETLSEMLATAYKEQAELETTLTLARSNLQMAIANTEMLEDTLRMRGASKDVGWRRSRPPGDFEQASAPASPTPVPQQQAQPPQPTPPPQPQPQQRDSRFLSRFRFGSTSGAASPKQTSPVSPRPPVPAHAHSVDDSYSPPPPPPATSTNHLTSASLPSLPLETIPEPTPRARVESAAGLRAELAREKAARSALEDELEALSAALFEEANKMVATERRARAEAQEELRTVAQQRDALKEALRVVETENGVLRGGAWTPAHSRPSSAASVRGPDEDGAKHRPAPLQDTLPSPLHSQAEHGDSSDSQSSSVYNDAEDAEDRRDALSPNIRGLDEDDLRTPRHNGGFPRASLPGALKSD